MYSIVARPVKPTRLSRHIGANCYMQCRLLKIWSVHMLRSAGDRGRCVGIYAVMIHWIESTVLYADRSESLRVNVSTGEPNETQGKFSFHRFSFIFSSATSSALGRRSLNRNPLCLKDSRDGFCP